MSRCFLSTLPTEFHENASRLESVLPFPSIAHFCKLNGYAMIPFPGMRSASDNISAFTPSTAQFLGVGSLNIGNLSTTGDRTEIAKSVSPADSTGISEDFESQQTFSTAVLETADRSFNGSDLRTPETKENRISSMSSSSSIDLDIKPPARRTSRRRTSPTTDLPDGNTDNGDDDEEEEKGSVFTREVDNASKINQISIGLSRIVEVIHVVDDQFPPCPTYKGEITSLKIICKSFVTKEYDPAVGVVITDEMNRTLTLTATDSDGLIVEAPKFTYPPPSDDPDVQEPDDAAELLRLSPERIESKCARLREMELSSELYSERCETAVFATTAQSSNNQTTTYNCPASCVYTSFDTIDSEMLTKTYRTGDCKSNCPIPPPKNPYTKKPSATQYVNYKVPVTHWVVKREEPGSKVTVVPPKVPRRPVNPDQTEPPTPGNTIEDERPTKTAGPVPSQALRTDVDGDKRNISGATASAEPGPSNEPRRPDPPRNREPLDIISSLIELGAPDEPATIRTKVDALPPSRRPDRPRPQNPTDKSDDEDDEHPETPTDTDKGRGGNGQGRSIGGDADTKDTDSDRDKDTSERPRGPKGDLPDVEDKWKPPSPSSRAPKRGTVDPRPPKAVQSIIAKIYDEKKQPSPSDIQKDIEKLPDDVQEKFADWIFNQIKSLNGEKSRSSPTKATQGNKELANTPSAVREGVADWIINIVKDIDSDAEPSAEVKAKIYLLPPSIRRPLLDWIDRNSNNSGDEKGKAPPKITPELLNIIYKLDPETTKDPDLISISLDILLKDPVYTKRLQDAVRREDKMRDSKSSKSVAKTRIRTTTVSLAFRSRTRLPPSTVPVEEEPKAVTTKKKSGAFRSWVVRASGHIAVAGGVCLSLLVATWL